MKNILIIGDIMLDKYIYVNINKIANEAPIPVFSYCSEKNVLGGCGNVMQNMLQFNNKIHIITVVGNDNYVAMIGEIIGEKLIIDCSRKTTVKTRIVSDNKILLRYDDESTHSIDKNIEQMILDQFDSLFSSLDIVVFSDYNKGVLTQNICQYIIKKCNQHNKKTITDLKHNFDYFKSVTITKPNLSEAVAYCNRNNIINPDLIEIHKTIKSNLNCEYSIVTLGKNGISLLNNDKLFTTCYSSEDIIDVTGAGDIVLSVISSLYGTMDNKRILDIACYLGTLSVKKLGTYYISANDIIDAYKWANQTKILCSDILYYLKKSNASIVFTNGCFDILHIGHITYLEQAKKLGDYLIVAINSDESVSQLKGINRPINKLNDRIDFLKRYDFIDFIISFNDETPLELIKMIRPNILVKGGDYDINNIVGKEYAKQVMVLPYIEGKSTTKILEKIK
jgi:D-beta-D-heptose 7-phosphate kinase/D-beta-D-heptose 1-phosphate adenosyltransferase